MNWLQRNHKRLLLPPTPGNWYVDKAGTLFKVRALVYVGGVLRQALIDYPHKDRKVINIKDWNKLVFEVDPSVEDNEWEITEFEEY